jgi:hypothetical protein
MYLGISGHPAMSNPPGRILEGKILEGRILYA